MTFQPVVPFGGAAGWSFLQRTRAAQEDAFQASPLIDRVTTAFVSDIGKVERAEDLVNDRKLLTVALGAFGLDADIDNRFFIRKVLEGGTENREALANKLTDKRYFEMAEAFGFGDTPGARTALPGFAEEIADRYRARQFEVAVGNTNPDMRLLLGLERDLGKIADRPIPNDSKWFLIMGTPPVRTVFERALGLPSSIGTLDIDRQLETFKDRAQQRFGTSDVAEIANAGDERLTRAFLAGSDLSGGSFSGTTRGAAALALLTASSPVAPF